MQVTQFYQSPSPCGFLNSSGFIRALANILLLPHFHSGTRLTDPAAQKGSGQEDAKANQELKVCKGPSDFLIKHHQATYYKAFAIPGESKLGARASCSSPGGFPINKE